MSRPGVVNRLVNNQKNQHNLNNVNNVIGAVEPINDLNIDHTRGSSTLQSWVDSSRSKLLVSACVVLCCVSVSVTCVCDVGLVITLLCCATVI